MAKSKKSESAASSESKSAPKRKAPAKKAGSSGGSPMINTDFAAQSAARMLVNRAANIPISTQPQKKETSAFKQMKDSIAKPHLASMDTMLNSTATPGTQPTTQHSTQQKGHSQTYNADVTRTGVPRRTPG